MPENRRIFYLRDLLLIFLYLALLLLIRPELFLEFSEGFYGGDRLDSGLYVWLVKFNSLYVLNYPSAGFQAPFYYPFGNVLAYTDNFLLPSLLIKVLTACGLLLHQAYNLCLLSAMLLNAYFSFVLARYVFSDSRAAFFAGWAFLLSPFFPAHFGHPQLQFAFFLPAVLLACIVFSERKSLLSAAMIGANVVAAFFCSVYISLFCTLLASLALLFLLSLNIKNLAKRDIMVLIAANLPSLIALLLAVQPYLEVRDSFGARSVASVLEFSASPLAYFSAPRNNLLWGEITHTLSHGEAQLFPGALVLLLFLVALLPKRLLPCSELASFSGRIPTLFLCLGIFFFFASLGLSKEHNWSVFSLVYRFIPGFNAIRVPARLGLNTQLCVILLSAFGLSCLLHRCGKGMGWVLLVSAVTLTGLELKHQSLEISKGEPAPEVYNNFGKIRTQKAILALPLVPQQENLIQFIHQQTEYMHWIYDSGMPMLNGYSGIIPEYHAHLAEHTRGFPDARSLSYLSKVPGLGYIVYHFGKAGSRSLPKLEAALNAHSDQLEVIEKDAEGNLLLAFTPKLMPGRNKLLVPANSRQTRLLDISFRHPNDSSPEQRSMPIRIQELSALSGEAEQGHSTLVTLENSSHWKTFQLRLPKNRSMSKPQEVLIDTGNSEKNEGLLVRLERIRPVPSTIGR